MMNLSGQFSKPSVRLALAGCVLCFAALGGFFSSCGGLSGADCEGDDPGCDSTLFLWQFITSGLRAVPTHLFTASGTQVQIYSIDRDTGGLTFASSFGAGNSASRLQLNSAYKLLNVASSTTSGGLYTYSLATPTQPLKYAGSPLPSTSVTFPVGTPNGRYAYASTNSIVSGVAVDTTAQTLSSIPGLPLGTGCVSTNAMHSDGLMYYVSSQLPAQVQTYSIDANNGSLSANNIVSAPGFVTMVVTPNSKYLYGGTAGSVVNNVYGFALDSATGVVTTAVPGSPYAAATATDTVRSIAVDSRGRYLYTVNLNTDTLSGFSIDASTGALTAVPGSPYAAGNSPVAVAVSPDDKYVYMTSDNGAGTNQLTQFKINSDGSLTQVNQTSTNANLVGNDLDILYYTEPRY